MPFHQDLKDGKEIEKQFLVHLINQGERAGLNSSKTLVEQRFYDLYTSDGTLYEIKFDKMWGKTGNVYVEHKSLGTSKADLTVYKLDGKEGFYQIPTSRLREVLPSYKLVKGGDQKEIGTLVPLESFLKEFSLIRGG